MSFWLLRKSAGALAAVAAIAAMPIYAQPQQSPVLMQLEELPPQVRAYANRVLAHQVQINGAVTPERLSLSDVLRGRLSSVTAALAGRLPQADEEMIARFAREEDSMLAQVRAASSQRVALFCAAREGSAPLQAASWQDLQENEEAELTGFYQNMLDALTPRGSSLVRRHLSEQVAPQTRKTGLDLEGMAASMPEQVIAQFDRYCAAPAARPPVTIETQDQPRTGNGALTTFGLPE